MYGFLAWVTSDAFWFSNGEKSESFQDGPGIYYPKFRDLAALPAIAVLMLVLRRLFDYFVAYPLCDKFGIATSQKDVHVHVQNQLLEAFYKTKSTPSLKEIETMAKKSDIGVEEVQRWLRRRRKLNRPDLRKKFAEASWRCSFYFVIFIFGMVTLLQSPWFWDTLECWKGYPSQPLWFSVYWYYMFEGGFYVSLLFTVTTDVRRKDFAEQVTHHVATICLIACSYISNTVRIGTLVMAIHDVSDIALEGAKCAFYTKNNKLADRLFVLFSVVFIASRLIVYPFAVLRSTIITVCTLHTCHCPVYYLLNGLLLVLQLLHVFWAVTIIRMAIKLHRTGSTEKDARSHDEEESSSAEEEIG